MCVKFAVGGIVSSHTDGSENGRAVYLDSRQAPGVIPIQNFVRRAWHASAVAGSYLYIEGGEFSYETGDVITYQYSSATLSIDLSQDWTNGSVVLHTTSKPKGAPMLSSPAFAYDEQNDIFYSGFAGRVSGFGDAPQPPPISLWSFKPDGTGGGIWKREIGNSDPAFDHLTLRSDGCQAYGEDTALSLGGLSTDEPPATEHQQNVIELPGLLQLNMTEKTFTNSSAKSFNAGQNNLHGQMHYVPSFGPNGLFAVMGGDNGPENLIGLDNIWVYEPVMGEWFSQTATGNIPESRKQFCTAGLKSTSGTYEILLYGGNNGHLGPDAVPYDEIFILTLPAFHWLKVDYPPQFPRNGHTCNAVGGSQIIIIGGIDANPLIYINTTIENIVESTFNSSVDPFMQGLAIFDMTTLAWTDHYTANAPPYEQSDLVKTFYSENPQNGSQFTTFGLKTLFQSTHSSDRPPAATFKSSYSNPSSTPSLTPSTNPSPTTSPASFSSKTNKGTIAGGVLGGVVGLAFLTGLAYFFYRRRHDGYPQPGKGSNTPGLQGNTHPPQEVNGNSHPNELEGKAMAEVGGMEARQEMGYDEATGTERWPWEMEASGLHQ